MFRVLIFKAVNIRPIIAHLKMFTAYSKETISHELLKMIVPFETLFERILTQADQTSSQNISQTIYRGSSYIKRHHAILSYLDQSKTKINRIMQILY